MTLGVGEMQKETDKKQLTRLQFVDHVRGFRGEAVNFQRALPILHASLHALLAGGGDTLH